MGKPKIKGRAGVAFFAKLSLEADLKAFEWAYKHLPLSDEYKLRIIHVHELNNGNQPQERPDSRYDKYEDMETKFVMNYPDYSKMGELQIKMKAHHVHKYICGVAYEGENFEAALQHAIEKEGLDTLVLAWWEAGDKNSKGPPINRLESEGCSIVLLKVDSRKLTFSMPPTASTEVSAATAGAPSTASPPTNQGSNKTNSSTSSEAETPCPDRETNNAPPAVPPKSPTASITPYATPMVPTKGSNSDPKTKRSNKDQSTSSGSKTDTRTPAGRGKDTKASAEPLNRRNTKTK